MKIKKSESVFSNTCKIDKKKKVNRSKKYVSKKILDTIENGVTLEDLEKITKKLPIFKYKTQITIHGKFPKLNNQKVFGYKSIFQNKNGSIGVKYNAIDEQKRSIIASGLKFIDIKYKRSSKRNFFYKVQLIEDENKEKVLEEFKIIYERIQQKMFYGKKEIYFGKVYGRTYIVLEFDINAIYFDNIQPFLNLFGLTEEKIKDYEEKENQDFKQRKKDLEEHYKELKNKKQLAFENVSRDITYLTKNFKKFDKTNKKGIYIKPYYSSALEKVTFQVIEISKTGRQKLPRVSRNVYETLEDALKADSVTSSFESILRGNVKKVYKIR